uniref:2'-deoxynucleoside 5'-phosphate N-hydrolase 1 n=1 Tax=Mola mola TaxID=94237 RepID=A0A3Q3W7C8_MOLML
MKIYFCGSIRGGRDDVDIYRRLVTTLQRYGTVLTEHVSSRELSSTGEDVSAGGDRAIHDRDMDWLQQSEVIVAEVTQPSLGVGYELGRAVDMKKKIFLYLPPLPVCVGLSAMIRGADDGELFMVRDYSEDELENVLEKFFSDLKRT